MLTKSRKIKKKWIIVIIILVVLCTCACACVLLFGSFGNMFEYFYEPPQFEDTNVVIIEVNKQFSQRDVDFQLARIEAGDKYTLLYFSTDSGSDMITGVSLYCNNEKLDYTGAGTSTYSDSYIKFEPSLSKENLEIRIQNIVGYDTLTYEYPIVFYEKTAHISVDINGVVGEFIITLLDDGIDISNEGLQSIFKATTTGYPTRPARITLTKNGEEVGGEYSMANLPDAIVVSVNDFILEDTFIIIPIP